MTHRSRHIIQRQVLEISTPHLAQARHWEQRATDLVATIIRPGLERCFDRLDRPEEHLIIDRLELDLGTVTSQSLPRELGERLIARLEVVLRTAFADQAAKSAEAAKPGWTTSRALSSEALTRTPSGESSPSSSALRLSGIAAQVEALICFLEHGRLPWWYAAGEPLAGDWLGETTPGQLADLREALAVSNHARRRIVNHFADDFLETIFQRLGGKAATGESWRWLARALKRESRLLPTLRETWWMATLAEVTGSGPTPDLLALFNQALQDDNRPWSELIDLLERAHRDDPPMPARLRAILLPRPGASTGAESAAQPPPAKPTGAAQSEPPTVRMGTPSRPAAADTPNGSKPNRKDGPTAPSPAATPEAIYLTQAGLVLLHPFLVELFRDRGLLLGRDFAAEAARCRAVRLLAFLAEGREEIPEYDLLLPKLLCGMSWETALLAAAPLGEADRDAGNELLFAVINHWKALRNTTPDGLREGFLRRDGRLSRRDGGWHLEVERKGQDVLLTRLPWGCSIVRLPWMHEVLHVNWI